MSCADEHNVFARGGTVEALVGCNEYDLRSRTRMTGLIVTFVSVSHPCVVRMLKSNYIGSRTYQIQASDLR